MIGLRITKKSLLHLKTNNNENIAYTCRQIVSGIFFER